ncbi:plastid lipid-associated protein 3, chloroplastic isoform X2 [Selaginella moellendorffii]|uniref:plastid lipid-associated protein 3, chloroplastic isoform X2 n=1 Tax=Selaginella moellendorffii TaxID=88036 RepID=UPI000D1C81BD|nr:plastid lipid-associated protein 3, chloroplastic isoform X2 [Selaginella moellendorffii]|eukprot:XP_024542843.1 plastid lipid-associated protein 3, chloroplastic isoform X2 [Selaginella moellendorffii]
MGLDLARLAPLLTKTSSKFPLLLVSPSSRRRSYALCLIQIVDATSEQKQKILSLVEELERMNPTENPVNSHLLSGTWALLYTAPLNEEIVDRYAGTEEGPFLSRIKPLAFGTIKQTRSLQIIDSINGSVKNIADFSFLGINGSLCINAAAVKSLEPDTQGVRLLVTFESFVLTINRIRVATISLAFIKPKGWVDTTYLDDDMRVGRGDKGSIFVAVRTKMVPSL